MFNPIIRHGKLSTVIPFSSIPVASPGTALVLVRRNGEIVIRRSGEQPSFGEMLWKTFDSYYLIDVSRHSASFNFDFNGERIPISIEVGIIFEIIKPEEIIQGKFDDIHDFLEQEVLRRIKKIVRLNNDEAQLILEINQALESGFIINGVHVREGFITNLVLQRDERYLRRMESLEMRGEFTGDKLDELQKILLDRAKFEEFMRLAGDSTTDAPPIEDKRKKRRKKK